MANSLYGVELVRIFCAKNRLLVFVLKTNSILLVHEDSIELPRTWPSTAVNAQRRRQRHNRRNLELSFSLCFYITRSLRSMTPKSIKTYILLSSVKSGHQGHIAQLIVVQIVLHPAQCGLGMIVALEELFLAAAVGRSRRRRRYAGQTEVACQQRWVVRQQTDSRPTGHRVVAGTLLERRHFGGFQSIDTFQSGSYDEPIQLTNLISNKINRFVN